MAHTLCLPKADVLIWAFHFSSSDFVEGAFFFLCVYKAQGKPTWAGVARLNFHMRNTIAFSFSMMEWIRRTKASRGQRVFSFFIIFLTLFS